MRKDGDKHCGLSVYIWQAGRQEEMKEADNPLLLLLVTQLHLTLCDPTDCSMTAFPVLPCTRNTDSFQTKYLKKRIYCLGRIEQVSLQTIGQTTIR